PGGPRHAEAEARTRRAPPPPRGGRAQARQGGGHDHRQRGGRAADDRPRRHDHQLLLRYGGPPLRLCLRGRGDSPDLTLASASLSFGGSWLAVYPFGPSVKVAGFTTSCLS